MYLKMTYVVFFYKKLVPTCIYVIHYKFNQCEHVRHCNQIWLSTALQISIPASVKSFNSSMPSDAYMRQ